MLGKNYNRIDWQELVYEPFLNLYITRQDRRNLVIVKYTKWKSFDKHCNMLKNKYLWNT